MPGTLGMDTAAGLEAGRTLGEGAETITALAARLDAALESFEWTGPDAERVRSDWYAVRRPQLQLTAEHLSELAVRLQAEATAQDEASGETGAAGAGGAAASTASPGVLDRIGTWIGDRLQAGGTALARLLGSTQDLTGKVADVLTGRADWSISAIAASALGTVGSAVGLGVNLWTGEDARWLAEGPGQAGQPVPAGTGGSPALLEPRGLDSIMQSVTDSYAMGQADAGNVRITEVTQADGGRAFIVAVPGTESWTPSGGALPRDLTANLHLMAGNPTAAAQSVQLAMENAGVPRDAPVLLVGHSQGGMITGHLAADAAFRERFNVTNMLTYGAPIDHLRIEGVNVLQMGHTLDPVPRTDLGGSRLGQMPTLGQQIDLPSPGGVFDVAGNHSHVAYIRSVHDALGADTAAGAALRAYQGDPSMLPFLLGQGGTASAVDVEVARQARAGVP